MYLIHWLNLNNNLCFYKCIQSLRYDYKLGFISTNNHMILGIYYLEKNELYTYEEYKKLLKKRYEEKRIKSFKGRFLDKAIDILENLK